MGITVIIGGQYGSESKGKITSYLSLKDDVDYVVRCGGPNSGHTVDYKGKRFELKLLPAGFINHKTRLLIAAGALINPRILFEEVEICNVDPSRIGIDLNTGIISHIEIEEEEKLFLRERLGSTLSGTGAGVAKRVLRKEKFYLAKDISDLKPFLTCVSEEINMAIDRNKKVIIEGTQGYGLSLYHTKCYPYATSRDTTASSFLSEVGVSPLLVDHIIMAIRTYPIRVGGNSGPLYGEISWQEVQQLSRYPYEIIEYTTTTKRIRRVGVFDISLVKEAVMVNRPTQIALHGIDYIDYKNKGLTNYKAITPKAKEFIEGIEKEIGIRVTLIGTGPTNEELIDRRDGMVICPLRERGSKSNAE